MPPAYALQMKTVTKIRAVSDLLKTELPVAAGICVVAGEILALGRFPDPAVALTGFLTGFFISGFAMVSNDYFDRDVDKINHPGRPLPSGRITVRQLELIAGLLSVAGFLTAAVLGLPALIVAVVLWTVGFLYNWKGKETGLPGNVMVSSSVAMTFVFGGVAVGEAASAVVWTFGALAFAFDLAEEIAGGAMDVRGDERRFVRTVARLKGRTYALRVSGGIFALFVGLSLVPYALGWFGNVYLVLVLVANTAVVYFVLRLFQSQTAEEGRARIRQLYLTMVFFVVAFIVSTIV